MAENKTNAMRLLEKGKIPYTVHTYEAAQAVDGVTVAGKIGRPPEQVFKTLVTKGKNGCYVFVIPAAAELDLKKAARAVGEKAVEMLPVKELLKTTGYIRGRLQPLGDEKGLSHRDRFPRAGMGNHCCQRGEDRLADGAVAGEAAGSERRLLRRPPLISKRRGRSTPFLPRSGRRGTAAAGQNRWA